MTHEMLAEKIARQVKSILRERKTPKPVDEPMPLLKTHLKDNLMEHRCRGILIDDLLFDITDSGIEAESPCFAKIIQTVTDICKKEGIPSEELPAPWVRMDKTPKHGQFCLVYSFFEHAKPQIAQYRTQYCGAAHTPVFFDTGRC